MLMRVLAVHVLLAFGDSLLDLLLALLGQLVPLGLKLIAHLVALLRVHGRKLLPKLLPVGLALLR